MTTELPELPDNLERVVTRAAKALSGVEPSLSSDQLAVITNVLRDVSLSITRELSDALTERLVSRNYHPPGDRCVKYVLEELPDA